MSLINKMLQDLDARGGAQSGQGSVPQMRPVAAGGLTPRAVLLAGAGAAVILLAAGGWLGWRHLRAPAAPVPVTVSPQSTQAAQGAGGQVQTVAPPAAMPTAANAARAASADANPGAETAAETTTAAASRPRAAPGAATRAAEATAAAGARARTAPSANPAGAASTIAAGSPPLATSVDPAAARAGGGNAVKTSPHQQRGQDAELAHETKAQARQRRKAEQQAAVDLAAELKAAKTKARQAKIEAERLATGGAPAAASGSKIASAAPASAAARATRESDIVGKPGTGGVTVTSQQQGENAYRRGLAALQEGRVQEAISNMEQAVFLFPRHDTARQTLVGLLIENRRHDEAIRNLQFGLGLDPKQPQMAMILARLQIEKGGPAIETLQRTLPYAGGNGDYLAFLAGALQRAQRHREAAEQYQAALRLQPQNGVWWMGLGMSLQADKRNAEALDAFTHAKNAGNLSQELQNFVERKLQQLGR
ncbi:tetratricopeptide repeat protein [Pseudoduganella sp. LjRoot289]|uniref:tetratricopeptide repeat protein n=1 Tax=Pseudoduganella sp. LjRoot289 TaxID=3342314 RepID=UPI003ECCC3FF